jgi:hypothetical protein
VHPKRFAAIHDYLGTRLLVAVSVEDIEPDLKTRPEVIAIGAGIFAFLYFPPKKVHRFARWMRGIRRQQRGSSHASRQDLVPGLPLQTVFCCIPMIVGKATWATFLLADLMRHNGDFLVCRFGIEIRILDGV